MQEIALMAILMHYYYCQYYLIVYISPFSL